MLVFIMTLGTLVTVGQSKPHVFLELSQNELPTSNSDTDSFNFIPRSDWNARVPIEITNLTVPVPYVVIHHSYRPNACYDFKACCKAMRSMQNYHIDERKWWDIGYNFAVGSDGDVYEGRGWTRLGAHSLSFNTVSMGVVLIGDWTFEVPPMIQVKAAHALIDQGVNLGYIKKDYKLVGHRQVRDTECPGEALYQQLQLWPHYVSFPKTFEDLANVPELPLTLRNRLRAEMNETSHVVTAAAS